MSVMPPSLYNPAATPWRLVILLGALTAIGPMAIDMHLAGLTAMQRDLGATPGEGQASVASFFAGMALGQFIYGPASDRFGRRGPILIGLVIGTYSSIFIAAPVVLWWSERKGGSLRKEVLHTSLAESDIQTAP